MIKQLINRKIVIVLALIVGILQLFSVNYLTFVFNQQYILLQYQTIYENKDEIGTIPGVYDISGTDFVVAVDWDESIENGIVLNDDIFKIYLNGNGQSFAYEDFEIKSGEDIYNNFLVYRYSIYVTPQVLIFFLIDALMLYVMVILLLYLVCKIYEHHLYKNGHASSSIIYKRSSKIKMCIIASFAGIVFYSIGSLIIPSKELLIIGAGILASVVQIAQLKNLKKLEM